MFSFASASCPLLPLGYPRHPADCGDAPGSTRAFEACAWPSSLPRDPQLQAAQVPLSRSSRTIWKILHATGCLLTRSKELPHPSELRAPVEEIQLDCKDGGSVSPEQSPASANASLSSKSAISVTQEPRSPCGPKPETISTNKRHWKR